MSILSRERRIGLDLESNGFHSYPEQICLIQISTETNEYIVDPIAIGDIRVIGKILTDDKIEKILHSADYDIRSLDRDWGIHINNLYDTSIAAAFFGVTRLGLGNVLKQLLGVTIPKSKKMQRSDWGSRPLTKDSLNYAVDDVRYIIELRDKLASRIASLGRTAWVFEECARLAGIRYVIPDLDSAFLSIRGSRTLDGRGLSILKALHQFREREARRLDMPPFKIFADSLLVQLAVEPDVALKTLKGLGRYSRSPDSRNLFKAIQVGLEAPLVKRRPTRHKPRSAARDNATINAKARLALLKEWRTEMGDRLNLDPSLLWPINSLGRLSKCETDLAIELSSPEVRSWQCVEFRDSLSEFLRNRLTK